MRLRLPITGLTGVLVVLEACESCAIRIKSELFAIPLNRIEFFSEDDAPWGGP